MTQDQKVAESSIRRGSESTFPGPWLSFVREIAQIDFCRQVAGTYATQISALVLGLLVSIAVARSLGPAGRGEYAVAMAIGTLGVQFGNLGLHASNTFQVATDRRHLPVLLANSLATSLLIGGTYAVLLVALFLVRPSLMPVHGALLELSLSWVPIGLAYLLTQNLLIGIQDIRAYNITELVNRIGCLCLVLAIIFCKNPSPKLLFLASLTALAFSLSYALNRLRRYCVSRPAPSWHVFRNGLGFGFRAYLSAFLAYLVLRSDLFLVQYRLGAAQAGYYSIASSLADYLILFPSTVGAMLFPRLAVTPDIVRKALLTRKAVIGTASIMLPLLLGAVMLARPVVRVMFGAAFLPSAAAFVWLIPGIFALSLEIVIVQPLNSMGFPKEVIGIWIITTIVNVGANLWAIPTYGIVGASIVSSISYGLALFLLVALAGWRHYSLLRPLCE